ncbi:hypothetical protein ILYODFUR_027785 [Ilyodon furcidens]|uniref:Uncharacterized protein n=1 Tax=Ilyodon furcidens TaxID=33524 RepID=A0ABV0TPV2_9TELE
MKTHPDSASSTQSPAPSTPATSCPPPHSAQRWQGKSPAQRHHSLCPKAQQSRHHQAHKGTPDLTPRQTYPARGPWPAACTSARGPHHAPRNHKNTPHPYHCNDSPGRNINQLSYTITAQLIQMPVTLHRKRGHNSPTSDTATPPCHPPACHPNLTVYVVVACTTINTLPF